MVYTDNNGNNVTSAWRSDNGESYYLGSDGYMVRNTLLEDNGNYYYLRNGGQMLKNGWRFLENPSCRVTIKSATQAGTTSTIMDVRSAQQAIL